MNTVKTVTSRVSSRPSETNSPSVQDKLQRRVLMVVPHRIRDLEGRALIAYHLEREYGHHTRLCTPDALNRSLEEYSPDLLLVDDVGWGTRAELVRRAKSLGCKVVLLPVFGLTDNDSDCLRAAGKWTDTAGLIDGFLCWGPYSQRILLDGQLAPESKFHVVGSSRFDFYAAPYTALAKTRKDLLEPLGVLHPERPLIVWATSTPQFARDRAQEIRNKVEGSLIPEDEAIIEIEEEERQFNENSKTVFALAKRNPNWNVVIKVHPLESVDSYFPLREQASNIYIAFDAPIRDFLIRCDVLLQRGCTTASEAWMLNRPVVELSIEGARRNWAPQEYLAGNHKTVTVEEAERAITDYLSGTGISPDQQQARVDFISENYFRIDGQSSARCAGLIHTLLTPPVHSDPDHLRIRELCAALRRQRNSVSDTRWSNRIKDFLGVDRHTTLRAWRQLNPKARKHRPLVASREISQTMVDQLHLAFDRLHQN